MNRRSFFTRAFSAIVAARMARELSAVELRVIAMPEMQRLRNRVRDIEKCPKYTSAYLAALRQSVL